MFYEQSIQQSPTSVGEYQTQPINGEGWENLGDLLAAMEQSVADQGGEAVVLTDACPEWADDIRGRIHNKPGHVLAIRWEDGGVSYTGIVEIPDELSDDELTAIRVAAEGHVSSLSDDPAGPASPDDVDGWETVSLPVEPRDDAHEDAIRAALRSAIADVLEG